MLPTTSRTVCSIRVLQEKDLPEVRTQFSGFQLSNLCDVLFEEQQQGKKENWIAIHEGSVVGIVSLNWHSSYEPFTEQNIPEICAVCVLPSHRRQGIATALLNRVEPIALKKCRQIGIALSLDPSSNFAQRMYVKRGYIPDGNGLFYREETLTENQVVTIDSDLKMYLIKKRGF